MASAFLRFSFLSNSATARFVPSDNNMASEQSEMEVLRLDNKELKRLLEESRRQQAELWAELEQTRIRLVNAEDAEERLCSQLGDLEAESVHQARAHNEELNSLRYQLTQMESLLAAARAQLQLPC